MLKNIRIPSWLGHVLKALVAVAVLVAMFRGGQLHPEVIANAAHRWPLLVLVAVIVFIVVGLTAIRWRLLLHGQGLELSVSQVISLTMIGTLFSTVIPGSVSGDLVKAYYVSREISGRRTLAVATILMDRIIGLVCLATVASVGVIWNHELVFANRTLALLGTMALVGCVTGCIGLTVAVAASRTVLGMVNRLPAHFPARGLVLRLAEVLASYHGQLPRLLAAFALSVPVHLLGCFGMLLCLHAVGRNDAIPAEMLLFAFPLGMLAVAVPITPAGIGVGQAAFYAVCGMALPGSGSAGANAFTVYQAIALPMYLTGLIPYLIYRRTIPAPSEQTLRAGA